ncbi:MAG: hypothetical protein P4L83_11820 [Nevskia sp.]|nr:hypothetical protein [Nevskia sp.]
MAVGVAAPEVAEDEMRLAPQPALADPVSSFAALLKRLESEGVPAALSYEQLRRRLIVYFRLHLPAEAEALADVTFDRMARRLEEGVPVREIRHYALGVARLVCLEARAREQRSRDAFADPALLPDNVATETDAEVDAVQAALAACLQTLPARNRDLILAYYSGDGAQRRRVRQSLAAEARLSLNALRNKALRIREALEQCVLERLKSP